VSDLAVGVIETMIFMAVLLLVDVARRRRE
jgi:hypothetical protein